MNRFAGSTPTLIIIACLLGILVTIISFVRVLNDYNQRAALQLELQEKRRTISRRISLINEVATRNFGRQLYG